MTTTSTPTEDLSALASAHLWGHFSKLTPEDAGGTLVIERGDGCYVWDHTGKRYLDGLAGLFTVQAGHGRRELAQAAAAQAEQLAYFPVWTYAHPTAVRLATRLAALAPGDLNRVFLTTGGGEAVETAWKLARQYHVMRGDTGRYKVISRELAYHGTTLGALTITGLEGIKEVFAPMLSDAGIKVPNTNSYRYEDTSPEALLAPAEAIEAAIVAAGPETVAAVFLEPVQNSGGCFTPPEGYFAKVREICDRHGVLLVSDEVICAFGRLGSWFGADRLGYQPDMITMAKGLTSGYSPLGGVMVSDRIADAFLDADEAFLHGITFGGHPVSCAVALANLDLIEQEGLLGHVTGHEALFRKTLEELLDLPIVGDVRGMGYFYGIELVKDTTTKETFAAEESDRLLRGILTPKLIAEGLLCRADDRGEPVIQLSPPLTAGPEEFEEIGRIIRLALLDAMEAMGH
ncbi:aspartate aminotransferase family protein [Aquihabitans sp. G128]|uniref:aspartate aminotransferase family protein n=1 Tax=Aquihabitans sp. G128 TaxID=2849779 RepID=UPI001C21094C|nr:aspartate aminotransferase family protein [Aquihabitans sp. G128]QXC61803.1 aspartate aminotransferase family protein [Aquihabitans sp. G128]